MVASGSREQIHYSSVALQESQETASFLLKECLEDLTRKIEKTTNPTDYFNSLSTKDESFDSCLSGIKPLMSLCTPTIINEFMKWYNSLHIKYLKLMKDSNNIKTILNSEKSHLLLEYFFANSISYALPNLKNHLNSEKTAESIFNLIVGNLNFPSRFANNLETEQSQVLNAYAKVMKALFESNLYTLSVLITGTVEKLIVNEEKTLLIDFLKVLKLINIKLHCHEDFQHSIQVLGDMNDLLQNSKLLEVKRAYFILVGDLFLTFAADIKSEYNVPIMKELCRKLLITTNEITQKKKNAFYAYHLKTSLLMVLPRQEFLTHFTTFLSELVNNLKAKKNVNSHKSIVVWLRNLIWIYCVKYDSEEYSTAIGKFNSFIPLLFPRNSKVLFPKAAEINFFTYMITSISKANLDYAMKEIIYELLCIGQNLKLSCIERYIVAYKSIQKINSNLQLKLNASLGSSRNIVLAGTGARSDALLRQSRRLDSMGKPVTPNPLKNVHENLLITTSMISKIMPYINDLGEVSNKMLGLIIGQLKEFEFNNGSKSSVPNYVQTVNLIRTVMPIITKVFLKVIEEDLLEDALKRMLLSIENDIRLTALNCFNILATLHNEKMLTLKIFKEFLNEIHSNPMKPIEFYRKITQTMYSILNFIAATIKDVPIINSSDSATIVDCFVMIESISLLLLVNGEQLSAFTLLKEIFYTKTSLKIEHESMYEILCNFCPKCLLMQISPDTCANFLKTGKNLTIESIQIKEHFFDILFHLKSNQQKIQRPCTYLLKIIKLSVNNILTEIKKSSSSVDLSKTNTSIITLYFCLLPPIGFNKHFKDELLVSIFEHLKLHCYSNFFSTCIESIQYIHFTYLPYIFSEHCKFGIIIEDSLEGKKDGIIKSRKTFPNRISLVKMLSNLSDRNFFKNLFTCKPAIDVLERYSKVVIFQESKFSKRYSFYYHFLNFLSNLLNSNPSEAIKLGMFSKNSEKLLVFFSEIIPSANSTTEKSSSLSDLSQSIVEVDLMFEMVNKSVLSLITSGLIVFDPNSSFFNKYLIPWNLSLLKSPNKVEMIAKSSVSLLRAVIKEPQSLKWFFQYSLTKFDSLAFFCFVAISHLILNDSISQSFVSELISLTFLHAEKLYFYDKCLFDQFFSNLFTSLSIPIDELKHKMAFCEDFAELKHYVLWQLTNSCKNMTEKILIILLNNYYECDVELKPKIVQCIIYWLKNYNIVRLDSMNKKAVSNCELVLLNLIFMISEDNFDYDSIKPIIISLLSASAKNPNMFLKFFKRIFTFKFAGMLSSKIIEIVIKIFFETNSEYLSNKVINLLGSFTPVYKMFAVSPDANLYTICHYHATNQSKSITVEINDEIKNYKAFCSKLKRIQFSTADQDSIKQCDLGLIISSYLFEYPKFLNYKYVLPSIFTILIMNSHNPVPYTYENFLSIYKKFLALAMKKQILSNTSNKSSYIQLFDYSARKTENEADKCHEEKTWQYLSTLSNDAFIETMYRTLDDLQKIQHTWNRSISNELFIDQIEKNKNIISNFTICLLNILKDFDIKQSSFLLDLKDKSICFLGRIPAENYEMTSILLDIMISTDVHFDSQELMTILNQIVSRKETQWPYFMCRLQPFLMKHLGLIGNLSQEEKYSKYLIVLMFSNWLSRYHIQKISSTFFDLMIKSALLILEDSNFVTSTNKFIHIHYSEFDGLIFNIIKMNFESGNLNAVESFITKIMINYTSSYLVTSSKYDRFSYLVCMSLILLGMYFKTKNNMAQEIAHNLVHIIEQKMGSKLDKNSKLKLLISKYCECSLKSTRTHFFRVIFLAFAPLTLKDMFDLPKILFLLLSCESSREEIMLELLSVIIDLKLTKSLFNDPEYIIILYKYRTKFPVLYETIINSQLENFSAYPNEKEIAESGTQNLYTIHSLTTSITGFNQEKPDVTQKTMAGKSFRFEVFREEDECCEERMYSKITVPNFPHYSDLMKLMSLLVYYLKMDHSFVTPKPVTFQSISSNEERHDSPINEHPDKEEKLPAIDQTMKTEETVKLAVLDQLNFLEGLDESDDSCGILNDVEWNVEDENTFDKETLNQMAHGGASKRASLSLTPKVSFSYSDSKALFNAVQNKLETTAIGHHSMSDSLEKKLDKYFPIGTKSGTSKPPKSVTDSASSSVKSNANEKDDAMQKNFIHIETLFEPFAVSSEQIRQFSNHLSAETFNNALLTLSSCFYSSLLSFLSVLAKVFVLEKINEKLPAEYISRLVNNNIDCFYFPLLFVNKSASKQMEISTSIEFKMIKAFMIYKSDLSNLYHQHTQHEVSSDQFKLCNTVNALISLFEIFKELNDTIIAIQIESQSMNLYKRVKSCCEKFKSARSSKMALNSLALAMELSKKDLDAIEKKFADTPEENSDPVQLNFCSFFYEILCIKFMDSKHSYYCAQDLFDEPIFEFIKDLQKLSLALMQD